MATNCKYGFPERRYRNGRPYWKCPLKPCKFGARYPTAYEGKCPKEPPEQRAARLAAAKAEKARLLQAVIDAENLQRAATLFGSGGSGMVR